MDGRIRRALDEGLPRKRRLSPIALLGVGVLAIGILPGRTSPAGGAETPIERETERSTDDLQTLRRYYVVRAFDAGDDAHATQGVPEFENQVTVVGWLRLGSGSAQAEDPSTLECETLDAAVKDMIDAIDVGGRFEFFLGHTDKDGGTYDGEFRFIIPEEKATRVREVHQGIIRDGVVIRLGEAYQGIIRNGDATRAHEVYRFIFRGEKVTVTRDQEDSHGIIRVERNERIKE